MNRKKLAMAAAASIAVIVSIAGPRIARAADEDRVAGEQRRWTLQFRTRLEHPGEQRPIEISLSGEWVSTVSAVRPGEYDVALEFAGARLKGEGIPNNSSQAIEQVERRLARTFWATYRDDGALLAVYFFKDVDPSDRNLLQMIATEVQLVQPGRSDMVWTVLERDGAGSYLAVYNRDGFQAVIKRKLKYLVADGEAGVPAGGLQVNLDQSELRFTLDPDGGIAALDAKNSARIGIPLSDQAPLVAITETHLANLRRSLAPKLIGSLARAGSDVVNSPIVTHRSDPEKLLAQHDSHLLEGRSTKSLLDAAMAKKAEDPWLAERLAALFRRRPEATPAAVALLRQSGSYPRITTALATAASPAALEALGSLARQSSVPIAVRVDTVTALGRLHHPSSAVMRIVAALLANEDAELRSAAQLTSGALARAGRSEHLAEADAIDSALIARYRAARELREICDYLAALGNSVGPSVLPVIEEALRDSRVSVRVAAARSLRLAEPPAIDNLLCATMATDLDSQVRSAAIFAASFRRPTVALSETLQRAARADLSDSVRASAVSLLRQHPQDFPGTLETLAWVAEHDPKPSVRRIAGAALTSISTRGSR